MCAVRLIWLLVLMHAALCSQELPFKVENAHGIPFDAERARKLYDAATFQVARELNPSRPLTLRPTFTLVLGAEHAHGDCAEIAWGGLVTVWLKRWEDGKFAYAVVNIAIQQSLDVETRKTLAQRAVRMADATVSVRELKNTGLK